MGCQSRQSTSRPWAPMNGEHVENLSRQRDIETGEENDGFSGNVWSLLSLYCFFAILLFHCVAKYEQAHFLFHLPHPFTLHIPLAPPPSPHLPSSVLPLDQGNGLGIVYQHPGLPMKRNVKRCLSLCLSFQSQPSANCFCADACSCKPICLDMPLMGLVWSFPTCPENRN